MTRVGYNDHIGRAASSRTPKYEIIIVCEGKVTEPRYFNDLKNQTRNPLVSVRPIGGCGVPPSVVKRAIEELNERKRTARRERNSFDALFEVWAVFDRDAHPHPQVPEALALARQHGVKVAYSNPCFELWGLMHFECWSRPGHHHDIQRALKERLPGYCHETNPVFDIGQLVMRYADAVKNAKRALQDRIDQGQERGDPSTNVFELTERLLQFGRP
jgi:hypothetical protein